MYTRRRARGTNKSLDALVAPDRARRPPGTTARSKAARLGAATVFLALSLAACTSSVEPDELELRIGVILDLDIEEPRILVPDTVAASTSFTVEVRTIGDGCARQGETRVDRQGATIVITPYDYHYVGPLGCEDIMLVFPHVVELEAGEPGMLRVDIVGRPWSFEDPVTLVREVEVTPPAP